MKESKILYIAKRLSKNLDKKNDEAIRLVKHFNERIERYHGSSKIIVDTYAENKSFWLGYSKAIDYCQKEMAKFIADIKENKDEDLQKI